MTYRRFIEMLAHSSSAILNLSCPLSQRFSANGTELSLYRYRLVSIKSTYFRSRAGMEIDLIVEGTFGTLPIEIKLGSTPQPQDIRRLSEFVSRQKLSYGLLINNAQSAGWLTENIYQLPAGYL